MPEPFTIISFFAAGTAAITGWLANKGVDFAKEKVTGFAKDKATEYGKSQLAQFRDNARLHLRQPDQSIPKALRLAYLQATLQVSALQSDELGPNVTSYFRSKLPRWKRAYDAPLGVFSRADVQWLDGLHQWLRAEIDNARKGKLPPLEITEQDFADLVPFENDIDDEPLRKRLTEHLISEIEQTCPGMPDRFRSLLTEGWDQFDAYEQAQRITWFDCFCVCFQQALAKDPQAREFFQTKLLAGIAHQQRPIDFKQFTDALRRLNEQLAARDVSVYFDNLSLQLDEEFVALHAHLDIVAGKVGAAQREWEEHQHTQIRERELRLRAMLADHSGFVRDRLASFVGRARELDEIRQRIAEKLPHGGYVTITGQAGQGKSSVIAKLVEESGFDNVTYHFIPFNPGPDHQISLLRNLMARLILKYKLSDIYLASESRPALRDFLPNVLTEVAARGWKEVIFIDGLDQLLEDSNGERDLSFLPTSLPAGIVCVLGTRPNDTLKPLELLKPHQEYQLPDLSRSDFDLILIRRGVALGRELADRFYSAMQANALYLDLVAKELAEAEEIDPGSLIQRLADNPDNIFSLTVDRLKRQQWQWREVIKPTLGLLLAACTPLGQLAIRQLLGVDGQTLREGLQKLGGLLAQDVKGRYHLFHLKLRDFLRQDERRPNKIHIFDTDEEEIWHSRLVDWCEAGEGGLDVIWQDDKHNAAERERRIYAREHYITHLYLAKRWEKLWSVLDAGLYGKAKIQYDPSTRSYANDLRLGCQASTLETLSAAEKTVQLPRLWRYVLLHCSLIGEAKLYPEELFTLLVLKHRDREAIELIEFLPNPETKVVALCRTAQALGYTGRGQEALTTLRRGASIARDVHDKWEHVKVFRMLARTLAELGEWDEAVDVAYELGDSIGRVNALAMVAEELAVAGEKERFEQLVEKIKHLAGLIGYNWEHEVTSHTMMRILDGSGDWNQIINETWRTGKSKLSEKNIVMLSKALVGAGHQRVARSMVHMVDGTNYKSEILVSVAKQLAKSDDRPSASHLLEEMVESARATEGPEKIDTLISAALYNSAIGRREAAARLLADSLPAMQVVDDSNERIHTFVAFAEDIADLGDLDSARPVLVEAQGLGLKIRDEQDRSTSLKVIAEAYAGLGDDVAATDLYAQSGGAPLAVLDSDNIEEIAKVLVAQGHVQQAIDLWMSDKFLEQLVQQKKWEEAIEWVRKGESLERRAAQTAVVARSVLRIGERGLALKFLKEVIDVAARISKRRSQVQVYLSIVAVAAESGSVDDVVKLSHEVIASINLFTETKEKVDVLYQIAISLSRVGLKDFGFTIVNEMMQIVTNVGDYTVRSYALRKLSKVMTRYDDIERLIALIQQQWLRVTIRDEALKLLPTVSGLISRDPEIIYNFMQSFIWVDDFLKVT